jgi:hypothetical protein
MKETKRLAILGLLLAGAAGAAAKAQTSTCATGTTGRLTFQNNCGDDAWIIETPPGSAAAVQAQWNWFKTYATKTNPLGNGGYSAAVVLKAGTSSTFCVPDQGSPGGNFRFYMGCPSGNTDPFNTAGCTIGAAAGDLAGVNTLFEPTFGCRPTLSGAQCAFNPSSNPTQYPNCQSSPSSTNCQAIPAADNFDISAVDGYTLPVKVVGVPLSGSTVTIDGSMLDLASCPTETTSTLYSTVASQQKQIQGGVSLLNKNSTGQLQACVAPYKWFMTGTLGTPANSAPANGACNPVTSACFYSAAGCDNSNPVTSCPGGSGPQQKVGPKGNGTLAIQNTNWVQQLYMLGYNGYTWQYGDGVGNQSTAWGTAITVTLCPAGGTPYTAGQLWTFAPSAGTCSTSGKTGTPDNKTTWGSLFACQSANMLYTCDNYTANDPYNLPTGLWKADPVATLAKKGSTYSQMQALRKLTCSSYTLQIPTGGGFTPKPSPSTLKLPECNYFAGGTSVCPAGN